MAARILLKKYAKKFIETFVISFIVTVIINFFLPKSFDFFLILPDYLKIIPRPAYILILTVIIFWNILPKRETWESLNTKSVYGVMRSPEHIHETHQVKNIFGVNWRVLFGSHKFLASNDNDIYYYVEGPYCPLCDYELDEKTVPKLLGYSKKHCWYCEDCKKFYDRPKKQLFNEEDVVIKKVQKNKRTS